MQQMKTGMRFACRAAALSVAAACAVRSGASDEPTWTDMSKALLEHVCAPREAIDLNSATDWKFATVRRPTDKVVYGAVPQRPGRLDAPGVRWQDVTVPGKIYWPNYEKTYGCYRRTFSLTAEQARRHVDLCFEIVGEGADVYVNGRFAGQSLDWSTPFRLDATGLVREGENRLEVLCWGNVCNGDGTTFPTEFSWFTGWHVGLARPVHVEIADLVHIADVRVETRLAGGSRLAAFVTVTNGTDRAVKVGLAARTQEVRGGRAGIDLGAVGETVPPRTARVIEIGKAWQEPHLWSPDDPFLYFLDLTLTDADGGVRDAYRERFGFREVRIDGTRLLFNGHPMFNRRVGGDLGVYWDGSRRFDRIEPDDRRIRTYIARLKKRGVIAIRNDTPALTRVARICDEEGFLCTPHFQTGGGYARKPSYWPAASNMVYRAAAAYKNHPSILYWCLFNEFGGYYGLRGKTMMQYPKMCQLGDYMMSLDPTRFWTSCGDVELRSVDENLGGPGPAPVRSLHYPINMNWHCLPEAGWWYVNKSAGWQGPGSYDKPVMISEDLYHGMNDCSLVMGRWGNDAVYEVDGYVRAWRDAIRMLGDGYYYDGIAEWNPWCTAPTYRTNKLYEDRELMPTWLVARRHAFANIAPGEALEDALYVRNYSFTGRRVTLRRRDTFEGAVVKTVEESFEMAAGERRDMTLSFTAPKAAGSRVGTYEVAFDLVAAEGGATLATRTFAFNVIPLAKKAPKGVVLLTTTNTPLQALFVPEAVCSDAQSALRKNPTLVVLGRGVPAAEAQAVDAWVAKGNRAVRLVTSPSEWAPLRVVAGVEHTFAYRRDAAFLPDLPESVWSLWRPKTVVSDYAMPKPVDRDVRNLLDNGRDSFTNADVLRVAQGKGSWLMTTLPLEDLFDTEPAARYLAVRLMTDQIEAAPFGDGTYAFLEEGHPLQAAFVSQCEAFLPPGKAESSVAVLADGSRPISDMEAGRIRVLAEKGATVFVTEVGTNTCDALLAELGLRLDTSCTPEHRRNWFSRTSNEGLMAGLSNDDFFFTSGTLFNYFNWELTGRDPPKNCPLSETPLVPALIEGGKPLLFPAVATEVAVGRGRVVVSTLPWSQLFKGRSDKCQRVWRQWLVNAGARTTNVAASHTYIVPVYNGSRSLPSAHPAKTPLWAEPGKVSPEEAWFGNGDDMRYFPVNLCGWSRDSNNKCPVEPFPAKTLTYAGIPFRLTPGGRAAVDEDNFGIQFPEPTRVERVWVLAALESDEKLKVGDGVLWARFLDAKYKMVGGKVWARYGQEIGSYSKISPLTTGRIGWQGYAEKTKMAYLYVFALENPQKDVPCITVDVSPNRPGGWKPPRVAILAVTAQRD